MIDVSFLLCYLLVWTCIVWQTLTSIATGKLHRALRLSVEHIPDGELQDIEEEDEEDIEEDIESEDEFDEEDAPKDARLNQDGVTSDETDMESFSKSRNCCITVYFTLLYCL